MGRPCDPPPPRACPPRAATQRCAPLLRSKAWGAGWLILGDPPPPGERGTLLHEADDRQRVRHHRDDPLRRHQCCGAALGRWLLPAALREGHRGDDLCGARQVPRGARRPREGARRRRAGGGHCCPRGRRRRGSPLRVLLLRGRVPVRAGRPQARARQPRRELRGHPPRGRGAGGAAVREPQRQPELQRHRARKERVVSAGGGAMRLLHGKLMRLGGQFCDQRSKNLNENVPSPREFIARVLSASLFTK
mmetsp:Transcript_14687/g.46756  ORF Transcript_14687/g.46756 Transcript_14687/m.46756 type:complete len:249 (+) Transcript_14687:30-776(+)